MAETPSPPPRTRPTRLSLSAWLMQNPVILKEMRNRMRGSRTYLILSLYLITLSSIVGIVYLGFVAAASTTYSLDIRQALGRSIFGIVVGFQLLIISFVAPAMTASGISAERENQTFDLVRTTLLPARSLVMGKLNSALYFILLLLFASLPLQSLAFLFGGVTFTELVISIILMVVTALGYCAVGIFFSSFTRRTLVSTVLSYASTILLVFGLPFFALMLSGFFGASLSSANTSFGEQVMVILIGISVYLMIAVNPLLTAIFTDVILLEEQTAFFFTLPLGNGINVPVLSPWIAFVLIYLGISAVLILLSVLFVKRVEQ